MGEEADYLVDQMIDSWFNDRPRRRRPKDFQEGTKKGEWRISGGDIIKISDMTNSHLQNAHRVAKVYGSRKLTELEEELQNRKLNDPNEPDEIPF